jgi:hypothetical protein
MGGATAVLVLGLRTVGFPLVALWAWRVGSVTYLALTVFIVSRGVTSSARLAAALNVLLSVVLTAASFLVQGFPTEPQKLSGTAHSTVIVFDGVRTWHGTALCILAVATIVFLFLFVRAVQSGITPQLESNWGGIGGAMGGWRLSASLTYLGAAAVFGVLFAIFVFHLDQPKTTTQQPPPKPPVTTSTR